MAKRVGAGSVDQLAAAQGLDPESVFALKATGFFGLAGQLAGGGDGHGGTSMESLTAGPQEGDALLRDGAEQPLPPTSAGDNAG